VHIQIAGPVTLEPKADSITLAASSPDDTNTIDDPKRVVPVDGAIEDVSSDFTRAFPPYSISVVKLQPKTRR